MNDEIRLVDPAEALDYSRHVQRADSDSGHHGPHYHAYQADEPFDVQSVAQRQLQRWERSLAIPGWGRSWGWFVDGRFVGHLDLRGGEMRSDRHRAMLGMGIITDYRSRGGGTRLLEAALAWARAAPEIAWVDLGVFHDNPGAERLYRRFGFTELGRRPDAFRVDGMQIGEIEMTLRTELCVEPFRWVASDT